LARRSSASSLIRLQRRRLEAARELILRDSQWFARNPEALVRFRPEQQGDFGLLELQGREAPAFIPEGLDPAAPLNWVAVVDVLRAIDLPAAAGGERLRARIRTVPIRSRKLKAQMAQVFAIAVCRNVLAELQGQLPDHAERA